MVRKETEASGSIPKRFPLTKTIWNSLGTSKMQLLFFAIFLMMCPFLALFLKEFNSIYQMRVANNPTYDWPLYSDLLLALLSSIIITLLLFFIKATCTGLFENFISERYQGKERKDRAEKMVKSAFKGSYFFFAAVFAYFIAKDSFFMPRNLGGIGNVEDTFLGYPYFSKEGLYYFKEYFMIQLGYHFSSLVVLIFSEIRNDFMEMLLHHSITVFLLSLAYLMNYLPVSLMILYTHDISDAFVCLVRVFVDTKHKYITFVCYVLLMISWVYTRLYVFPFDLIRIGTYHNPVPHEIYGMGILGAMAHILVVLHIYWFYLLVKMGIKFIKTSTPSDLQNNLSNNHQ